MRWILATALWGFIATATHSAEPAQPPKHTWLYFSHVAAARAESREEIHKLKATFRRDLLVRPLAWSDGKLAEGAKPELFFQEFHAYLHNPTEKAAVNVVVELECLGEKLESEKIDKLEPDQYLRVKFQKPKPPMPAPAPGPMPGPRRFETFPLTFTANVNGEIEQEAVKLEENRTVAVDLLHPAEYVAVRDIQFTSEKLNGDENNRLTVKLEALQGFAGPPCEASLDLSGIDGLRKPKKLDGRAEVNPPGGAAAEMKAEGLEFDPASPRTGRFAITVDGYLRGFVYHTAFEKRPGTVQPIQVRTSAFRLRHPDGNDLSKCLLNTPFTYLLEPENIPLDAEVRIERDGKPVHILRGSRQRQVWLAGRSESGGVLIRGEVRDWPTSKTEIKTADLNDKREVGFFVNNQATAVLSHGDKAEKKFVFELVPTLPDVEIIIQSVKRMSGGSRVKLELAIVLPAGHAAIKGVKVYPGKADEKNELPVAVKEKGVAAVNQAGNVWTVELETLAGPDKPVEICVIVDTGTGKPIVKNRSKQPADQKATLTILVMGGEGKGSPISGVTVEVSKAGSKDKPVTGTTGDIVPESKWGKAAFLDTAAGVYEVVLQSKGGKKVTKRIDFAADKDETIELRLD